MSIRDMLFGKAEAEKADDDRPVMMVREKENVWRVVYANPIKK